MKDKIIIVSCELKNAKDDILIEKNDDPVLIRAINEFSNGLKKNNIEIWEQHDNIIIAEDGYYLAIYPDRIKEIVK